MDKLMLTRSLLSRSLAACAAVALFGAAAACGGEQTPAETDGPSDSGASRSADEPADEPANGFCDSVEGIGDDLALVSMTQIDDPAQYQDQMSRAAERFASVEPPDEIVIAWGHVSELFTLADDALQDVVVETADDITDALSLQGDEAFGMVLRAPGQAEVVGVFVQETCQVDLGLTPPAVDDVCTAVDVAHLGSVFGDSVPEGENRRWGAGVVECLWDDGGDVEVGVVVMPADAMRSNLLDGKSPLESVQTGGDPIEVYDGALGPFRAAAGRTAATVVGDTGVLASVRSGDTSAEGPKAIALAGLVAADLG